MEQYEIDAFLVFMAGDTQPFTGRFKGDGATFHCVLEPSGGDHIIVPLAVDSGSVYRFLTLDEIEEDIELTHYLSDYEKQ